MGDEDDGVPLLVELLEEHEHLERCTGVEVTRCLVGQQHGRIVDQRAGDGYTLHLTTRHLVGLMFQAVAETHGLQRPDSLLATLSGIVVGVVHQR